MNIQNLVEEPPDNQETFVARISAVSQPIDPKDPRRVEGRRSQESQNSDSSSTTNKSDRVKISSDAKDKASLHARLTEEAANIPDVREDKVADVKARIESGEFDANSDEVKKAVADGILKQFSI